VTVYPPRMRRRAFILRLGLGLGLVALLLLGGCVLPEGLPIARFTMSPSQGESPLVVRFDASGSNDPEGAIVHYDWSFGDGATGAGMSQAHTYEVNEETVFTVRLTVTDNEGHEASATQDLSVSPAQALNGANRVAFVWPFHYDADGDDAANLNDEYFTLQNTGTEPVDLGGWTVSSERGAVFRFPDGYVLGVGGVVFVHSGAGIHTDNVFYWNADAPIWNNLSDIAVLKDPTGLIIDVYAYVSC